MPMAEVESANSNCEKKLQFQKKKKSNIIIICHISFIHAVKNSFEQLH